MDRGSAGRGRFRWLWVLAGHSVSGSRGLGPLAPPAAAPAAQAAAPAQPPRMEGLSLTEIHEGDKTWVLEAKKADFHPDQDTISISGVRVEFFGPGEDIRVKAEAGLFNTKTRVLTLKGQVEMRRGDLLVQTSLATYSAGRARLARPRGGGDHGTGPQGGGQGDAGGTGRQEAGYDPTPLHRIAG